MNIEHGTVKMFKPAPENGEEKKDNFGFLYVLDANGERTGEEIFFHYSSGRFPRIGEREEVIFGRDTLRTRTETHKLRPPKKGDKVVFTRGVSEKGKSKGRVRVITWSYDEAWQVLVTKLAERPRFRVVREVSNGFAKRIEDQLTTEVIWEGQSRLELSAIHPRRERFGRIIDDLTYNEIEDGYIRTRYFFQVEKDGEWTDCSDPRVMLCCVPQSIFRRHARPGLDQGHCSHPKPGQRRQPSRR